MQLTVKINGKSYVRDIAPGTMLLDFLRQNGYSSVRSGCDTTNCGLCTVWIDGAPTLSCAYPAARAEGKSITTIEGIEAEAAEFASYMAKQGADQCGYCSPGFIMTVLAMKRELKSPTEAEIKHYLAGNLCRCTGYVSHMRILKSYFEEGAK